MSKRWCFVSDQPDVQRELLPFSKCSCSPKVLPHAPCVGADTKHSERYPPALADALVRAAKSIALNQQCVVLTRAQRCRLVSAKPSWRKKQRAGHWATSFSAAPVGTKMRKAGRQAQSYTSAPARKLCRGFARGCRGGLSVS